MTIDANSLAAGNFVSAQNTVFQPGVLVLQRKIVIIGSYDPAKLAVVDNQPKRVFSAEAVGAEFGFGFMLHRLAEWVFKGNRNVETWVVPQPEDVAAVAADGKISVTGPATEDGSFTIELAGQNFATIQVLSGETGTQIAAKILAALNAASSSIPTTQVLDGVNDFEVNLTSKSKGTYGNEIDISLNLDGGELPAGVAIAITAMANGATNPDIQDALNALGTDDNQNSEHFTGLVHGYGFETATLDKISLYNGEGNLFSGNYAKEVGRPFRSLVGDTGVQEAALAALIVLTNDRKQDRTNGVLAAPGSQNHPSEIAALAIALMEYINNGRAEQTYIDEALSEVRLGDDADRWTNKYDNRDAAVKAGISPTLVKSGVLTLQNVVSFYRPDDVPVNSNGFRSMRNISIIQNLVNSQKLRFELDKWKQITVVADTTKVNPNSKTKARDIDAVLDELISLAGDFESNAWIYSAAFTVAKLQEGGYVTLRALNNGFDIRMPVVLSGEGDILNQVIEFDTNLSVFL